MIKGLREILEKKLEPFKYVIAIFPKQIKRTKNPSSGGLKIKFQYSTKTETKLLVYGSRVVQGVFVVISKFNSEL
jgi:hypothetical protein